MNPVPSIKTLPFIAKIDGSTIPFDDEQDKKSIISDLTANSDSDNEDDKDDENEETNSFISIIDIEDASYDSIDEIDEEELENLLMVSKKMQAKRRFSPSELPDQSREEDKRARLKENSLFTSNYDNEVEKTADVIYPLFLERLLHRETPCKSTSTSCCFSHESSLPLRFHSNVFDEIARDSSLNSFWSTVLNNQA